VTRFISFLCPWLLPLFAMADVAPEVALRLVDGTYRPGDMLELQAEMRGVDYAEFELHVPANTQCHFVTQTREPVRYVEGVYVQRVLLQLQPLTAGDFELNDITVTIAQGGVARDVALPPVSFTVASYAAEDTSEAAAELGAGASLLAQASNNLRIIIAVLFIVLMVVWWLLRKVNTKPVKTAEIELGLSDLIVALEGNAPSFPPCEPDERKRRSVGSKSVATLGTLHGGSELTSMMIAEQLLARADLSMSSALRKDLEAAVYANRLNSGVLLQLLREEVQR
jgi:hypothetical protein